MLTSFKRLSQDEALVHFIRLGLVKEEEHKTMASGDRCTTTVIDLGDLEDIDRNVFDHCCHELACRALDMRMQYVVGLADGGNPVAQGVAGWLSAFRPGLSTKIPAILTEKNPDGTLTIADRDLEKLCWKRVLVVDDVLSYGTTYRRKLMHWLRQRQVPVRVAGFACLWTRTEITADRLEVPVIINLVRQVVKDWDRQDCPYCNPR